MLVRDALGVEKRSSHLAQTWKLCHCLLELLIESETLDEAVKKFYKDFDTLKPIKQYGYCEACGKPMNEMDFETGNHEDLYCAHCSFKKK